MYRDILIKGMNKVSNIEIDIEFIMDMVKENNKIMNELESFITRKLEIKDYCDAEVKSKLNLSELKNDILVSKFEETNDEIYRKIIEYRKLTSKKKSIENILKNTIIAVPINKDDYWSACKRINYSSKINLEDIESAYITPIFTMNEKNMVSVAKPSLNFLSTAIIKEITGFSESKNFSSIDELISFLKKFNVVIRRRKGESSYLIKGLTLYFNIKRIMPINVIEEFGEIYESKFPQEFDGLDYLDKIQKKSTLTESITQKNYECFKVVWEKCRHQFVLNIELIKEGYCDSVNFPNCRDEDERAVGIKRFSQRQEYENKLIKFINELKKFDIIAEKYEVELKDILKEFRKLELNIEEETKEYDEIIKDGDSETIIKESEIRLECKEYYDTKKAREDLTQRGANEEHIQEQLKKMKCWNDGINKNLNDNDYALVSDEAVGEDVADFLFAGKGK